MKIAIIGGGPGGYVAALAAAKKGGEVVLIEKAQPGGTCLNKGCIPTKAILHSANLFYETKEFAGLGIKISHAEVDFEAIMERKNKIVAQLRKGVEYLLSKAGVQVIHGEASFESSNTLKVTTNAQKISVSADKIIIASGSVPIDIPFAKVNHTSIINSDSALELNSLPKSMVIVGGGVIGCEFAQGFHRLGCDVTLIEMLPALIDTIDTDLSEVLRRTFVKEGIKTELSATLKSANETAEGVEVAYTTAEGTIKTIIAEKLFIATGRKAYVTNLNLDKAGVNCNEKGIITDSTMCTNVQNIYAIGDVTGGMQLAHVASHQGIIAVNNIFGKKEEFDESAVPYCIYTSPELASMGVTQKAAQAMNIETKIGMFPVTANGRAMIEGCKEGFSKTIVNKEDETVLGVHIASPNATEMVSLLSGLIKFGATTEDVEEWIFAHPSVSEIIHESVLDANKKAIHK